jgi:integrase/recombinase XerC
MPEQPTANASDSAWPTPVQRWLEFLHTQRRYSGHTLAAYERDLRQLVDLAKGLPLEELRERQIRQFLATLHGVGHKPRSLSRILSAWRSFYTWWGPQINLPINPTLDVRAPKSPRPLPKALPVDQTQVLLDNAALTASREPATVRDRAMFELFYSSGLRLSELVGLDIQYHRSEDHVSEGWIDLQASEVQVLGKGGKMRTVPVGTKALLAISQWLTCRDSLLRPDAQTCDRFALFLGERGRRIHPRVIQQRLTQFAQSAGLPAKVHPHVLRHSFASHLLQSAHDLRAVQEMLGHASISTTQIYTRLDFQHLSAVYDAAHPRATRKPKTSSS